MAPILLILSVKDRCPEADLQAWFRRVPHTFSVAMTNFMWRSSASNVEYSHTFTSIHILYQHQLFSQVNQNTSQSDNSLRDSSVQKTTGTAVVLNRLPWKRDSLSRPDCCKMISVFRYTVWAPCKKAAAHRRCFQASLKWNSLLLFITRCSIMNVRKVERAAVIYFQGIGGDAAVLWESTGSALISGVLTENPVLSHNKCLHFQSMWIITGALRYWFTGTHNIFMKYSFGYEANESCKSWCVRSHSALCFIFFLVWLNNQGRTFIIPVRVLLHAQLIMVNQPKPPAFPDLIIRHAFV